MAERTVAADLKRFEDQKALLRRRALSLSFIEDRLWQRAGLLEGQGYRAQVDTNIVADFTHNYEGETTSQPRFQWRLRWLVNEEGGTPTEQVVTTSLMLWNELEFRGRERSFMFEHESQETMLLALDDALDNPRVKYNEVDVREWDNPTELLPLKLTPAAEAMLKSNPV